jgi:hypothetical protein
MGVAFYSPTDKVNAMLPPKISQFEEINSTLRGLAGKGESLEISAIYKGVSLTQKFTHIRMNDDRVQFRPPHQICCVEPEKRIYIRHTCLPMPVVASVLETDINAGYVTVGDFRYIDHCWQMRQFERVQPCLPLRAILSISQWSISASVADISNNGLGLLIYGLADKGLDIRPNLPVQSGLRLPGMNMPLVLSGRVARVTKIGNSAMVSLGIETYPNEKQSRQLNTYISSRQSEILDELAQIVRFSMEPVQPKDMFF